MSSVVPVGVMRMPVVCDIVSWMLQEIVVDSEQRILQLMDQGNALRAVGCTAMNSHSSRSHSVFQVQHTCMTTLAAASGSVQCAALNAVQLSHAVQLFGSLCSYNIQCGAANTMCSYNTRCSAANSMCSSYHTQSSAGLSV